MGGNESLMGWIVGGNKFIFINMVKAPFFVDTDSYPYPKREIEDKR